MAWLSTRQSFGPTGSGDERLPMCLHGSLPYATAHTQLLKRAHLAAAMSACPCACMGACSTWQLTLNCSNAHTWQRR
eukprot:1151369-Pelagomonas_calceolata.AAC.1